MDSKSKGKISESQSRRLTSMGIIEYLAKNNLSKEQAAYSAYMDQLSKIITKRTRIKIEKENVLSWSNRLL